MIEEEVTRHVGNVRVLELYPEDGLYTRQAYTVGMPTGRGRPPHRQERDS